MQLRDHSLAAKTLARDVARSAIWIAGFAVAGLIIAPAALLGWGAKDIPAALALAVCEAAGLLTLGISAVLRLNAALFQLMASHGDEISGGMRADEFLARAGLQAEPAVIRRLSDRAGVVRRLQTIQRLALAVFVLAALLGAGALAW